MTSGREASEAEVREVQLQTGQVVKPKFKIVSDGTQMGTKVIDIESGEEMKYVKEVSWFLDLKVGFAEANITLFPVAIEAVGAADRPADVPVEPGEG